MADGKLRLFTDTDMDTLRQVIRSVLEDTVNPRLRSAPRGDDLQSPDVYLARIPRAGIPALTTSTDPIFSGSGTGSGDQDVPGSASCAIFRCSPGGAVEYTNLTRPVYNFSPSAVIGGRWAVVTRDKWGRWLLASAATGGSNPVVSPAADSTVVGPVHVVLHGAETSTGTGTTKDGWYCQAIEYNGSNWAVSAGPVDYSPVREYNDLEPRHYDVDPTPGAVAYARTILYRDRNGNYFVDYPYLSDGDTFSTPLTWTVTCTGPNSFSIVPATYQTVRVEWDNWSDFPRINVSVTTV